ncbi:MAG: DUF3793 family protein [Dorea sp.]
MPVEVVSYMLASQDIQERLKFQIILQCAPFLKGIKKASIMNVHKKYVRILSSVLSGAGIEYKILAYKKERYLVLFYRREEFQDYLSQDCVQRFLEKYNYDAGRLDEILAILSKRICSYSKDEITFPHEIGIFLDYPLEDVEGFIKNEGKNSLMCGYWKVYHAPGKAQMIFLAYDKAKDSAVNEFLIGKSIQEIAKRRHEHE